MAAFEALLTDFEAFLDAFEVLLAAFGMISDAFDRSRALSTAVGRVRCRKKMSIPLERVSISKLRTQQEFGSHHSDVLFSEL